MKCPKCGAVMYSSGNGGFDTERGNYVELKYICSKCGYEVKDNLNDLIHSAPFFQPGVVQQPDISVTNYGWICPKCGAVLSPSTQECPYCTPYKATCGTISGITTVPTNDITSQAQTLKSSSQTLPDNITVTGNGDLTTQPQAETKVSK